MDNKQRVVVRISSDSLSFSTIVDGEVVFEAYPLNASISMAANLREAVKGKVQPANGLVVIDSPIMMIPVDLFLEGQKEELYLHTFTKQEQQAIMHYVLPDLNCVAVFSVRKDVLTVLRDTFTELTFMPAIAPVWRHLHQRSYTGQHQKLYAYFHERRVEVFAFAQNRFKFCNSFAANNPNDALYYMLAVWKQLAMAPDHDELYLVGDMPEQEVLLEETKKFVKRVFYINPSGEFNRAPVTQIEGMPYDLMVLFVKGERL